MKALSLWQPWAELVASGAKRRETRSWGTAYRGELAIHAAKNRAGLELLRVRGGPPGRDDPDGLVDEVVRSTLEAIEPDGLTFGAIIAVVTLADVVPMTEALIAAQSPVERALGDWRLGRFAWILEDVRRLEHPQPYPGRQGLFSTVFEATSPPGVVS